jgi:tRNA(Ser,Leu) C12 N-acetylase TAN1/23S rRNA U2552 (ribose-2'-O)-methylase RlmE/FtsJ
MSIERLANTTFLVTCGGGWEPKAREEVMRMLPDGQARPLFMRGNVLATCALPEAEAMAILAAAETEFIGRVIPLQVRCDIGKGEEHLQTLCAASDLLPGPDPQLTFKARCERRGLHAWTSGQAANAVGRRVEERTGAPADLNDPAQVVRIEVFQDLAFLGVCRTEEILHKGIAKMRIWEPGTRPLNRAELKLHEILERHEITLPPEGRALDIGAAPGGWTKVLAEHMAEVVAVDPGELDPRVTELPNVVHLRMRSEALLTLEGLGQFDVVTNDMNLDPGVSARVLCDLVPVLRPGAIAVLTAKFVTRHRRELVQEALDALSEHFEDFRIGRVAHNAKETTIVARLKR